MTASCPGEVARGEFWPHAPDWPAPGHPARPGATPSWHAGQVTDFTRQNLSGARFEYVYMSGADFHGVDLTGARFRLVDLTRVTISGSALRDVDISGQIDNVRINGVDVVPLVVEQPDALITIIIVRLFLRFR